MVEVVLQQRVAARKIARFWKRVRPRNDTCAVTLAPLQPPIFRYYPEHDYTKRPIGYDLHAIIQNIKVTGKLLDPCTREDYTTDDFQRLDALTRAYNIPFQSPLAIRERLLNEMDAALFTMFRATLYPPREILHDLLAAATMRPFMILAQSVREMAQLDPDRAMAVCARMLDAIMHNESVFSRFLDILDNEVTVIYTDFVQGMLAGIADEE